MLPAGLLLLLVFAGPTTAAASPEQSVRVTTDSVAYCAELVSRLSAQPTGASEPARSLAQEGSRLCEIGHVRTGIAKLRRALRAAQAGG